MVVRSKAQQTERMNKGCLRFIPKSRQLGMHTKITRPVCNSFKICGRDPQALRTYKANIKTADREQGCQKSPNIRLMDDQSAR